MTGKRSNRVLVNSMPKSGTHLLMRVMDLCGYRDNAKNRNLFQKLIGSPPRHLNHKDVKKSIHHRITSSLTPLKKTVPIGAVIPVYVSAHSLQGWLSHVPHGSYMVGHIPWSQKTDEIIKQLEYKHILIVRDPRDVLLSSLHYIQCDDHPLRADFNSLSRNEQMTLAIKGGTAPISGMAVIGICSALQAVFDWRHSPNKLLVRFEDLVGEKGGGQKNAQEAAIKRVCEYLNIDHDDKRVTRLCAEAFDANAPTFRSGQIGGWKMELAPAQLSALRRNNGRFMELMNELGYVD